MKYEIPYADLEVLEITRESIDSLPREVKETLMGGGLTPFLEFTRQRNGVVASMPCKMQINTVDGRDKISMYPAQLEMVNNANLTNAEFLAVKRGDVISKEGYLLQRDPETNQILMKDRNERELDMKIAELEKVRDIELGTQQKTQLKEGKPVELDVGGEKVTVGLDLRDKDHFKSLNGDMSEWKRQKEIEYDILHPEFVGLVQTDENRWEQQMIRKEGYNSQSLKERPAQTRSSGMRM